MKEIKFKLPSNADSVTVKVEDGFVVASYKPKRWRAETGGRYYCVNSMLYGECCTDLADEVSEIHYKDGNYFRTKEQAEKVAKEIRAIFEKHKNE